MQLTALIRKLAGSIWVRATVTAGLLAAVATRIDFGQASRRISAASWPLLIGSVAVLFASLLLGAVRWRLFLQATGIRATRAAAVRAHLIGMFTTNFLPSQVGGDVTRAWIAAKPGTRVRSLASVALDRSTALFCLVLAAWLAVAGEPSSLRPVLAAALAFASGVVAIAGAVIGLFARTSIPAGRRHSSRLVSWTVEARLAARAGLKGPVLGRALLLGLPFQGLVLLAFWMVARAIRIHAPFAVLAAALPAVLIVSALPISIGGFGVREASYTVLLGHAGVARTDAAVLSILFGLSFALATTPGAAALIAGRSPARRWLGAPTRR